MIAELSADGGRINVYAQFREKEMVKEIPGSRWDNDESVWWLPVSWAACVQLRGVFGVNLEIGPNLNAWVGADLTARINPCLALREAEDCDLPMFGALYPFQRAGVGFMVTAGSALNADEMGLGKSVQAIASLEFLGDDAYPALIVCPNSMKHSWHDEFARWAPGRKAIIITGTAKKRQTAIAALTAGEAEVGIINYEALRGHTRLSGYGTMTLSEAERTNKELNAVEFGTVVADEAHKVKDPKSKQTRALWYVGDRARHRYALTGTPIANSPLDIWALMRFVAPTEYPWKSAFVARYALETFNIFGYPVVAGLKSETSAELFKVLDPRFIRRLKSVVLPQLPEKIYSTRYVKMETEAGSKTKQGTAYENMRKEMVAALDSGVLLASSPLVQATRLCQFASAYGELVPTGEVDENGVEKTNLILTDPSCKADALEEILLEVGDGPVVVFAESKQLINLCHDRLVKASGVKDGPMTGWEFGLITGDVPDYLRAENVRRFQAGELKVLLLTLAAGGEGLTLTAASTAVFLQRSFNAVQNAQAEDRIHRIGQDAACVNIIDVVTEGTIEERVRDVLVTKAGMLEEVARDAATIKAWLAK